MEIVSFLKLLTQTKCLGFEFFLLGWFSQCLNLCFLCFLLVLGLKFLFFKCPSLLLQFLENISPISPKIECYNSFDQEHTDFNNTDYNNGLDQKKPIILHCTYHGEEEGSEEEESGSRSDEDQVSDVITLRKMVKRESKRGDRLKIELEKERRSAESAAKEAMAMLLKLRMEKSEVEMEARQYKRVAEQKQVYDQEVIQSLQWMLMKLYDEDSTLKRRFKTSLFDPL